ncbi:MAG: N-acetylmuramoyl-L-alanine amidase [Bacteroidales bacterium]|nr:N-acetylmuramoyl-L-alanine amidase [Bacteroidales bacterium]
MQIKNLIQQLEWHTVRRWSTRELSGIRKIIFHQELGDSTIEQVNSYHIKPNHISPRGCPHFAYHYGIRKNGEIIQANELSQITWHTKGENSHGIGIMLVGNFKGNGNEDATDDPTDKQIKSAEELANYLIDVFKLSKQDVFGHYQFGKPVCPGFKMQEWIENFRNDISEIKDIIKIKKTVKEIQKRLNSLGYAAGPVDDMMGVRTRYAIRRFQTDNLLETDGIVGPQTWKKLLLLTQNG